MTRLEVTPSAQADLREAAAYLNPSRRGAGAEFRRAVREAFAFIRANPRAGTLCGGGEFRRRLVPGKSRYLVVWEIDGGTIRVISIFYGSREPDSWMDLLGE